MFENFASLVGNAAPNDAVKKFRIGPPIGHGNEADGSNSETFLLQQIFGQVKVWKDKDTVDPSRIPKNIAEYYTMISGVSDVVLNAICQSLDDKLLRVIFSRCQRKSKNFNFGVAWIRVRGYRDEEENFRQPCDGVSSY